MTRQIGHSALRMPSAAAVAVLRTLNFQPATASTIDSRNAMTQTLCPAIFSPLSATMSHKIGSIARINFKNSIDVTPLLDWYSKPSEFPFFRLPEQRLCSASAAPTLSRPAPPPTVVEPIFIQRNKLALSIHFHNSTLPYFSRITRPYLFFSLTHKKTAIFC